jgi:hypothetical protein
MYGTTPFLDTLFQIPRLFSTFVHRTKYIFHESYKIAKSINSLLYKHPLGLQLSSTPGSALPQTRATFLFNVRFWFMCWSLPLGFLLP